MAFEGPMARGVGYQPKDPGSIPSGGPKRFHDSFNFVFYIVGECLSSAVDTSLARIRPLSFNHMDRQGKDQMTPSVLHKIP